MDRSAELQAGLTAQFEQQVELEHSAPHLGSGNAEVFATPAMVALVERTCARLVQRYIAEGETTVGVSLVVSHQAPTPVGATVAVGVELVEVDGERLRFKANVRDDREQIGIVEHERMIVDHDRFMRRVESKKADLSG